MYVDIESDNMLLGCTLKAHKKYGKQNICVQFKVKNQ